MFKHILKEATNKNEGFMCPYDLVVESNTYPSPFVYVQRILKR